MNNKHVAVLSTHSFVCNVAIPEVTFRATQVHVDALETVKWNFSRQTTYKVV